MDGQKGHQDLAPGLGDPDGLVQDPIHAAFAVDMVHGPQAQGQIEGVVGEVPKIQGVPLDHLQVGHVLGLFPQDLHVFVHQL